MANKSPKTCAHLQDADDSPHPALETRIMWPEDMFLRCLDFVIHTRPRVGPATWRRYVKGQWIVYTHEQALRIAQGEHKEAKLKAVTG